jgi:hypothetical protein
MVSWIEQVNVHVTVGANEMESSFAQATLDAGEEPMIGSKPADEYDRLDKC